MIDTERKIFELRKSKMLLFVKYNRIFSNQQYSDKNTQYILMVRMLLAMFSDQNKLRT